MPRAVGDSAGGAPARMVEAEHAPAGAAGRFPWRGFLIGAVLLPWNGLWLLYTEHIFLTGVYPTTISLFFNVVFILFFLALANRAVRRVRPRWGLTQGELITVYV